MLLVVLVAQFSSVQLLSHVRLFATPGTAARQASLSITNSQSSPKPISIELVMPSNPLILCCPLLLLPSVFPSIRVFSNESVLHIRQPEYWSFSFSISPSNEHPGLISFRMDWLDILAVQRTLKSLLKHHSSEASIILHSAFFIVQLSYSYMTTGKTIALTRLSHVQLFATPWTVAHQVFLSMEFYRQEYYSGLPFPSPGSLLKPGIKPGSPALQADSLPSKLQGSPTFYYLYSECPSLSPFPTSPSGTRLTPTILSMFSKVFISFRKPLLNFPLGLWVPLCSMAGSLLPLPTLPQRVAITCLLDCFHSQTTRS